MKVPSFSSVSIGGRPMKVKKILPMCHKKNRIDKTTHFSVLKKFCICFVGACVGKFIPQGHPSPFGETRFDFQGNFAGDWAPQSIIDFLLGREPHSNKYKGIF
jgi:hypothetical protein